MSDFSTEPHHLLAAAMETSIFSTTEKHFQYGFKRALHMVRVYEKILGIMDDDYLDNKTQMKTNTTDTERKSNRHQRNGKRSKSFVVELAVHTFELYEMGNV